MIVRITSETGGAHVHLAVFAAPARGQTFAKIGDLTVRAGEEWAACRSMLVFLRDYAALAPAPRGHLRTLIAFWARRAHGDPPAAREDAPPDHDPPAADARPTAFATEARAAYALYTKMHPAELRLLQAAFTADMADATLPETIAFAAWGRIALIAAALSTLARRT